MSPRHLGESCPWQELDERQRIGGDAIDPGPEGLEADHLRFAGPRSHGTTQYTEQKISYKESN